jgi:ketosteroid isomerase-like protein
LGASAGAVLAAGMSWSVRCTGIRVARAENTSWAYASDWEQFENWCERYGLTLMPGPDKSAAVEYANERIRVAGRRPGPHCDVRPAQCYDQSERRTAPMNAANEMNVLADRITRAYEQNDMNAIAACYAPEARIWHNFDGGEQTVGEQLDATRWLNERLKNLKYEIVSRHSFDGGYVQQHVVHGTLANGGEAFRMPACMNVTVRDGQIARLDEYLDSAHLKPLQTA